jgi:Tfp pilus assembly protein PilF
MTEQDLVRMRATVTIGVALLLTASATSGALGQAGGMTINPKSVELAESGYRALAGGHADRAIDHFETALAVDPKNERAFIGMARAAQAQGLPGKAVKFYREALSLDPNDLVALEGQGAALVERGSTTRAKVNLVRIQELCGSPSCPPAKRLETKIAAGPPKGVQTAEGAPAQPPVAQR